MESFPRYVLRRAWGAARRPIMGAGWLAVLTGTHYEFGYTQRGLEEEGALARR